MRLTRKVPDAGSQRGRVEIIRMRGNETVRAVPLKTAKLPRGRASGSDGQASGVMGK